MAIDPLSDLIHLADAKAVVSAGLKASGSWSMPIDVDDDLKFVAVTEGQCWISIENGPAQHLERGDCFLLRGPVAFTIGTELGGQTVTAYSVFADTRTGFGTIDAGDGSKFSCIGGKMEVADSFELLTSSLQSLVILRGETKAAVKVRWLLEQLVVELAENSPGGQVMCEQIMHMIFIEMIRIGMQKGKIGPGLLSILSDPKISPAVMAMHGDPKHHWTLSELAGTCNLSRSRFAARFSTAAGMSPIEYLFRWRMHLAKKALSLPGSTLARVAEDAGYQSEAAFGSAFKRMFGFSPRNHRVAAKATPREELETTNLF
ncbi:AraC family transcriptional regulator [Rhizobium sp. GCM10022189]|uniref:AraC family transcriptional regulator n=1 Tax=Rhizobium sp. GCM10022189 TaxID=3252654 RepID=UPI0036244737